MSSTNEALVGAAVHGHVAEIERQIAAGADPNAFEGTAGARTPLQKAAAGGHLAAIAALLKAGARVDGVDSGGITPLMLAAFDGRTAAVNALVAAGADVHRSDIAGETALHYASGKGHLDAARVLLDAGARMDVRNKDGNQPIDVVRALARCNARLRHAAAPPRCNAQVCTGWGADESNEATLRSLLGAPPAVKPRAPATPVAMPAAAAGGAGARSPAVAAPAAAGGAGARSPAVAAPAAAGGAAFAPATRPTVDATVMARERKSLAATLAASQAEVAKLRGVAATRDATIAARDRDARAAAAALAASNEERDRLASALATSNAERDAARKAVADRDATITGLRRELDAAAAAAGPLRGAVHRLTAANELMHAVLHPPLEAAVRSAYLPGEDVALVRDGDGDRVRLGGGAQGDVYVATLQCVVKVPKLPRDETVHNDATVTAFWQEVAFHQPLCHPHIVVVHGGTIVPDPVTGRAKELRMVMERCGGGTLEGRLHGAGAAPGPLKQRLAWGAQVLSALVYLHARDIIHADLKPENVLLEDGSPGARAKLSDFGLAKQRADTAVSTDSLLTFRGSWGYMDPRLMDAATGGVGGDSGSLRKASDVYSAGVMLWELTTVRRPYRGLVYPPETTGSELLQTRFFCEHVTGGGRPGTPAELAALAPAGLGALIGRMWAARAEDRPTIVAAGEELARLAAGLGDA
jgi:hypothetical protein